MKKSLLVTGATSLAVAALPVVGVFAANSQSFTDNIKVTVPTGCTMEIDSTVDDGDYADREFEIQIPAGSYKVFGDGTSEATDDDDDSTITIACNASESGKDWVVKATASDNGETQNRKVGLFNGNEVIEPGTDDSGDTSAWAMKIDVTDGNTTPVHTNAFSDWSAVPSVAETEVLRAPTTSVAAISFRPVYRVFVAPDQAPGDYEGEVVYTIELANHS